MEEANSCHVAAVAAIFEAASLWEEREAMISTVYVLEICEIIQDKDDQMGK